MAQPPESSEVPPPVPAQRKPKKWLVLVVVMILIAATVGIAAVVLTSRPPQKVLDRVEVVPPTSTIVVGGTKVYTARAFDATGALIDPALIAVQWSVVPASLGRFTNATLASVLFNGDGVGSGTVTAAVTYEAQTKSAGAAIVVIAEGNWAVAIELTGLPASAKVGTAHTGTVRVVDRFSQTYGAYGGTVRFSATPSAGVGLPSDYAFGAADSGSHTFPNGFTFATPGPIAVTVVDAVNATLAATVQITINPPQAPVGAFSATENQYDVSFDAGASSDPDGAIVTYAWDFGDTATGNGVTTSHTYSSAGSYTVTLTVTDDDTLTDSQSASVSLFPPTAMFTIGGTGMQVSVDASGSTDADANIVSYSWDWGDGSPAGSGVTASHTYAAEGSYPIALTVTDGDGFANSAQQAVALFRPAASFTSSIPMNSVSVDASASTDDGAIVSYSWDWGDGSPAGSGVTASHAYSTPGPKTVALTVTDDRGLTGSSSQSVTPRFAPTACFSPSSNFLTVDVDGSCSADIDGTIASYSWEWGDGTPAGSGVTATHTYAVPGTYRITLNVTDNDGFSSQNGRDVTVSAGTIPPTACFLAVVNGAQDRLEVDGACSSDADGFIASYSWEWGDGTPAGSGVTATHTYAVPGTYQVNLTVTDDDGLTDWDVVAVSWFPPTACFTWSHNQLTVDTDGSCSADPDGPISVYSWDWGDGSPAGSGVTASHTYAAGAYTITQTVTDADGFSRTASSSLSLFPPSASFTIATIELGIAVDGSASTDSDGTIASHSWSWGDGSPAGSGVAVSHTYAAAGRYTVTLTVADNAGLTGSRGNDASPNGTTLDFTFYDFFNVPLDTWWTDPQQRQRVYGDVVLNNAYPYITWYPWAGDRLDPTVFTMYRMDTVGRNLGGYSIDDPVMLPRFGPNQAGGSVDIDLYMQYVSTTRRTQLSAAGCHIPAGAMDGFIIEIQGTYTMNTATSRELFNVVGDPATWWPANTAPGCTGYGQFETDYETWLYDQGNFKHDVYNAFEYTYSPWFTDITAAYDAPSDTTTVNFHHITWAGEVLYARWFYWGTTDYLTGPPMGWWGQELGWFEDWTFNATITTELDFDLTTALAYQFNNVGTVGPDNTWGTNDDNSSWVWEPMFMDYLYQTLAHPLSELTPYVGRSYLHTQVGSQYYGTSYRYDYVPITWNLRAGESWTFHFPTGDVWFYDPVASLETSDPADLVAYAAPITFDATTPAGLGSWDSVAHTLRIVGPTGISAPPNPDLGQPQVAMGVG